MMYRSKQVAELLAIAPSTLRLWTVKLASELSESATRQVTANGTPAQRRFTEADVRTLQQAGELLRQGLRFEQVLARLRETRHERELERRVVDPDALQIRLADLQEALRAKDQALADKQRALDALEAELFGARQTVRDERQAREEVLRAKDETIAALNRELITERELVATLRAEAADLRQRVRALDEDLAHMRGYAAQLEQALDLPWWKRLRGAS